MARLNISDIKKKYNAKEKISVLTAYEFSMAKIIDEAGIDIVLVGDSAGMVVMGYDSTIPVTIDDMLFFTKSVNRAVEHALLVGDMPFLTYNINSEQALKNAGRFLQEAGTNAVKIEGGEKMSATVNKIVSAGIPVMGHIGLTPQSINQLGGFKVQGKTDDKINKLINDAKSLEQAGAFSIVLECIPEEVGLKITESISIPTIGIGAGKYCSGQVLVCNDILGLYDKFVPKFVKQYANLSPLIKDAVSEYIKEVKANTFPDASHSYKLT